MTGIGFGTAAIGLLFVIPAAIRMWHKHGTRSNAWLMLIGGLFLSSSVVSWFGALGAITLLGLGIWTLMLLVSATVFHLHVFKKKREHDIVTPVFAFLLGVSIVATFGGVGSMVTNTGTQLTSVVSQVTAK